VKHKFKIVDQDGIDCAGGELFDNIQECETWIDEYADGDEKLEIMEVAND